MNDRHRDSVKARRICFEAHKWQNAAGRWRLTCHLCKGDIDPILKNSWRADHIRRFAEDGEDTPDNLWPIHVSCDVEIKQPHDTSEVAKGKAVRDSLYIKNRPKGRPMLGSKRSPFKKKLDGTVERR
jgi:hypothetical protein